MFERGTASASSNSDTQQVQKTTRGSSRCYVYDKVTSSEVTNMKQIRSTLDCTASWKMIDRKQKINMNNIRASRGFFFLVVCC